jgi:hypothetical protein
LAAGFSNFRSAIMSISNLSLVNQKLTYASAVLADMASCSVTLAGGAQKLRQQALAEAAVYHLTTALHFYLREIADQYRVKYTSAINSIDDLVNALNALGVSPSEVNELTALKEASDSWLGLLLGQKNAIFKSPEKQKEKKAFITESTAELLSVVEINEPEPLVMNRQLLSDWLESFRELIGRHRSTYAEY